MALDFLHRYGVWLAIGVIVFVAIVWFIWPRFEFRRRMAARPAVDTRRMLQSAFPDGDIDHAAATKFLDDFAAYLSIPPNKLRLEDAFSKELAPRKGWEYDDELGVVEDYIMSVARKRKVEINSRRLFTVKDCIAALFGTRRKGSD